MMTREEYNQAFRAVYDTSSEKPGYEWGKWFSLEEVIQPLATSHSDELMLYLCPCL